MTRIKLWLAAALAFAVKLGAMLIWWHGRESARRDDAVKRGRDYEATRKRIDAADDGSGLDDDARRKRLRDFADRGR